MYGTEIVKATLVFNANSLIRPTHIKNYDDLVMKFVEECANRDYEGIEDKNIVKFFKWLNEKETVMAIEQYGLVGIEDGYSMWDIISLDSDNIKINPENSTLDDGGWLEYDAEMTIDKDKMIEFMVENSNLLNGGSVPFMFDEDELPKVRVVLDNIEWDISEDDFDDAYDEGYGEMSDWIEENGYTDDVENWDEQEKIDRYKEYIADTCGDPDSNIVWYDEGNDLEIEIPCIPTDNAIQIEQMFSDGVDRNDFYWEHINDVLYERFGIRAVGFDVEAPEEPVKATEYENLHGELDQILSGLKSVFEETISDFKVVKSDYSDDFYVNAITDCLEHQDTLRINIKEPYCKNGAKEVLLSLYDQQTDGWNVVVEADFGNSKNNKLEELYKTNEGYNERTFDEAREIFNKYSKVQLPSLTELVEMSKEKPMQSIDKADIQADKPVNKGKGKE